MKFLLRHSLPDLTGLPREYRKAAGRFVTRRFLRSWQLWVFCGAALGAGLGATLVAILYPRAIVTYCIFVFVGTAWAGLAEGRRQIRYLREYLTATDHCQSCAYDLRGTPSGVCPECGTDSKATKPPS